jgi:hypothetical protein
MLRKSLAIAVLALVALGIAGCPALMLGSLGYTGYQYEKTGKLPGMPDTSKSSGGTQKSSARPTPSPSSIE